MKAYYGTILFFLLMGLRTSAQYNSDYAQYMFNGLLVNPAYAGSQGALNITALYRKQWIGLYGSPTNASVSFHLPMKKKKVNVGGILMNDQFGVYRRSSAGVVYAYRVPLARGFLSLGLQGDIDSYFTNWNNVTVQDAGDPNFSPSGTKKITPKIHSGAYYHSTNFYLGLSLTNLITHGLKSYYLLSFTSGCVLNLSDNFKLKPAVLLKYIKNSPLSANLSGTFYFKNIIGLGIGYTHKSSTLLYTDIKVNDQLNFGYAYTRALRDLYTYTGGSHEVMLRYLFSYKIKAISARYF